MGTITVSTGTETNKNTSRRTNHRISSVMRQAEERKSVFVERRYVRNTSDDLNPKYTRTIQDDIEMRYMLRAGDRISFSVNRPWDSKGHYINVTDSVKTLYRNFAYTNKGYCVRYRDISRKGV